MSLISIIVPFFNNSETILRALNSVYNQTIQDFEVLLINDASPDWKKAEDLLSHLRDNKLQVLHHIVNLNGATARNTGIKAAKGKYIAFLDADDEWNSDHLEKSIVCLDVNKKLDLIFSKFIVKSNIEYILPYCFFKENELIGDYLFVKQQAIFTPSIFVKADVAKQILFNEKLRRHQDYDFLLRMEAAGFRVGMSNHVGGVVHWENNNITTKGGGWSFSLKWVREYKPYLSKRAYANFVVQFVINNILAEGDLLQAIKIASTEVDPFLVTRKNIFLLSYPMLKPFIVLKNMIFKKNRSC